MSKKKIFLFHTFNYILVVVFCLGAVFAQDKTNKKDDKKTTTKTVETEAVEVDEPQFELRSSPISREDEDDSKVTGATVRGRLIYEDTSRPVRYVLITLRSDKDEDARYSSKFVKTDENGEFVIKNVKAGTYTAYVKSDGILNQDSYKFSYRRPTKDDKTEEQFEKIAISGLGEFQILVTARRGGSISGRILFADGEAAVGVSVEAMRKEGGVYLNSTSSYGAASVGTAKTDDRGVYRITGLPEGKYIIRVIEPVSHIQSSAQYLYNYTNNSQNSLLKTYYPEGESSKDAKELELLPGQEQTAIDVTLPERKLFGISGKIVKKGSGEPLSNFTITFFKMSDRDEMTMEYSAASSATSNKAGEWALKSLPKGKYRITISQGYVYTQNKESEKDQTQYSRMSKEIEITDKNIDDFNFEVPLESAIGGTITVEGGKEVPPEVRIYAVNEETKETGYSDFDYFYNENKKPQVVKERSFRIGKLTDGKYRITAFSNSTYYLKSATLGGRDLLNSPFELKEGEDLKGVQIVLSVNMGTVKGKISGYDGKEELFVLMFGANATFEQARIKSFSGKVLPTGNFEIKAAPGEYSILVFSRKIVPKNEAEAKDWFENAMRSAQKITVKDNETTNISLSMPN